MVERSGVATVVLDDECKLQDAYQAEDSNVDVDRDGLGQQTKIKLHNLSPNFSKSEVFDVQLMYNASEISWLSADRQNLIRTIIKSRIPEWTTGPRDFQLESWAYSLDGKPQLNIVATGGGKTALFYGPLLIAQHLLRYPVPGIKPVPPKPVILIVTPLVELGNKHVSEMTELKIQALAVNADSVTTASRQGRDIWEEVRTCMWAAVVLSAERLASKEADEVLRDKTFRENLLLLGLDEAHVVVPWGLEFRTDYRQMGLIRKRLPEEVAFVAATATLTPGKEQEDLCHLLGLRKGHFHTIRLSCERLNVRTVIRELTHGLSTYQFLDIAWIATPGMKAVVYCETIDLGFRVALYLWSLLPPGRQRVQQIRLWNSLTSSAHNKETLRLFREDIGTYAIVATVAFGMGMDEKNIRVVVNVGVTKSLSAWLQQIGHGGRDAATEAQGITYVEVTVLASFYEAKRKLEEEKEAEEKEAREKVTREREAEEDSARAPVEVGSATIIAGDGENEKAKRGSSKGAATKRTATRAASTRRPGKKAPEKPLAATKSKQRKKKVTSRTTQVTNARKTEDNIARILSAHVDSRCLNAEINDIFGNPGPNTTKNCHEAKRPLPCSSCLPFWMNPAPASRPSDFMDPPPKAQKSGPVALTNVERDHAHAKLHEFARKHWSLKTSAIARHTPATVLWTGSTLDTILTSFHLLRSRQSLQDMLSEWSYIDEDGDALYELIDALNQRLDIRRAQAQVKKIEKAAATRARNKEAKAIVDEVATPRIKAAQIADESTSASSSRAGTCVRVQVSREAQENWPPLLQPSAPSASPPTSFARGPLSMDRVHPHFPPTIHQYTAQPLSSIPQQVPSFSLVQMPSSTRPQPSSFTHPQSSSFIRPQPSSLILPRPSPFTLPQPLSFTTSQMAPFSAPQVSSFSEIPTSAGQFARSRFAESLSVPAYTTANIRDHRSNDFFFAPPSTPLASNSRPVNLDLRHLEYSDCMPTWPTLPPPPYQMPQASPSASKRSAESEFTGGRSIKRPRNHRLIALHCDNRWRSTGTISRELITPAIFHILRFNLAHQKCRCTVYT
ncbi:hypothetical protein JAAARDRAFT_51106 [Jaapia argillacea MUCL 33604]|uniref:DNA 3'-5' helicase n=1 Tax=Jaapia argillacea MUCL 33604 TaxID=933084 RepID=A0A067P7E7_9AGAM|nr:hypothetical protein JAAARDRAFT_51106 [Jaapia argillacea MUCL 33604]